MGKIGYSSGIVTIAAGEKKTVTAFENKRAKPVKAVGIIISYNSSYIGSIAAVIRIGELKIQPSDSDKLYPHPNKEYPLDEIISGGGKLLLELENTHTTDSITVIYTVKLEVS
ncbi:hypothetical protein J7K74_03755 [Candidatus Woesearchaeota archaeon]|nr:hypothetical protein [Candidatus Woesearchaeota archaeon]